MTTLERVAIVTSDGYEVWGRALDPVGAANDYALVDAFTRFLEKRVFTQNMELLRRMMAEYFCHCETTVREYIAQCAMLISVGPFDADMGDRPLATRLLCQPRSFARSGLSASVFTFLVTKLRTARASLLMQFFVEFCQGEDAALCAFVASGDSCVSILPVAAPQLNNARIVSSDGLPFKSIQPLYMPSPPVVSVTTPRRPVTTDKQTKIQPTGKKRKASRRCDRDEGNDEEDEDGDTLDKHSENEKVSENDAVEQPAVFSYSFNHPDKAINKVKALLAHEIVTLEKDAPWTEVFTSMLPLPFDDAAWPKLARSFRQFWHRYGRVVWERQFWVPFSSDKTQPDNARRRARQRNAAVVFEKLIRACFELFGARFFYKLDRKRHPGWWYRGYCVDLLGLSGVVGYKKCLDYLHTQQHERFPDCGQPLPLRTANAGVLRRIQTSMVSDALWLRTNKPGVAAMKTAYAEYVVKKMKKKHHKKAKQVAPTGKRGKIKRRDSTTRDEDWSRPASKRGRRRRTFILEDEETRPTSLESAGSTKAERDTGLGKGGIDCEADVIMEKDSMGPLVERVGLLDGVASDRNADLLVTHRSPNRPAKRRQCIYLSLIDLMMEPSSPRSPTKVPAGRYASALKSPRLKPPVTLAAVSGLPSPPHSPATDELLHPPVTSSTTLPPLIPGTGAVSPRMTRDAFLGRPFSFALPIDREYPVARLDSWPLTTSTSALHWNGSLPSSPRQANPAQNGAPQSTSPLSPRARKSHARHKLFDDSKSTPLLLQQLYAFATSELQAIDADRSENSPIPNLQRLQVFRELFGRVIASFTVYAPLLAQIQNAYETVLQHLLSQNQLLPQLQSELQSLETQCLQQLSERQLETTRQHKALTLRLKQTQATLAACAAENAHLRDDNLRVHEQLRIVEKRYDDMHLSNHTLVNGMKRHDDTLRHIHERSREEGVALQQMTLKYHRACDEIAELKKTVAALEEKVGGVHVAAYKATIALLTKDLQGMHAKGVTTSISHQTENDSAPSLSLDQVFYRVLASVLERNGAVTTEAQLLEMIHHQSLGTTDISPPPIAKPLINRMGSMLVSAVKPVPPTPLLSLAEIPTDDLAFGIDRVASVLSEQIALFHQQTNQLAHRQSQQQQSDGASATTFLTEPPERLMAGSLILTPLISSTDLIQTRGMDADVPEYLQYNGMVRNLYYDRRRVEQLIAKVWAFKEDLEGKTRRHSSSSLPSRVGTPLSGRLAHAFALYLQRCFPSNRHDQVECAYNVVTALQRFASGSSECRLFHLILENHLPDEARGDQAKELAALHDVVSTMQRELKTASHRPGLPLADVVQALRRLFPWKSDAQLSRLHHALLVDLRGHPLVDFASLLQQPSDDGASRHPFVVRPRAKSQFVECLQAQYMDDLLGFRLHVQSHVAQQCIAAEKGAGGIGHYTAEEERAPGSSNMVAVHVLRECLQRCDPAKPVQEINRILTSATGLSMDQILTHDAMMVSVSQFITTLPTLLIKPSGKFGGDVRVGTTANS